MTYNIDNFLSYFILLSFLTFGLYTKYNKIIDVEKMRDIWEFICLNNPTIIDYIFNTEDEIKMILDVNTDNSKEKEKEIIKMETKYENTYHEKYMQKFRSFPNECNFSEEEKKSLQDLKVSLKQELITKYNEELKEITEKLNSIQLIIAAGGLKTHEGICLLLDYWKLSEEYNEDPDEIELDECWNDLLIEKGEFEIKLDDLNQKTETYNKTDEEIASDAYEIVLKKHLEKHKDNYILECTPLGNVYMRYNSSKEVFEYFSDSTLPYRYLETVARKYVMTFWCKVIYVDIEEELKKAEEEGKKKKELNLNQKQIAKPSKETLEIMNKIKAKNVKMSLPSHIQANLPSIQNGTTDNKHLLKERSNRYTWEGRLRDFCPLKKIDKKVVDKRLNLTFSEFKKMQQQNKKSV